MAEFKLLCYIIGSGALLSLELESAVFIPNKKKHEAALWKWNYS